MTTKKKYYAVLKGRNPGVYASWSSPGGAEEQVKGYKGAVFQSFASRQEAEYYLNSGGKEMTPEPLLFSESAESPAMNIQMVGSPVDYKEDLVAGKVIIFTDGASTGNPGPGGYGIIMIYNHTRKELSGGFRCTTNNRMELMACIVALNEIKRAVQVVLYSDSSYVIDAVNKGWARKWRNRNWKRVPDRNGISYQAENVDLWEQMLDLLDRIPVEFRWVKGHTRQPENERCDKLAVMASRRKSLPEDPGFGKPC